MLNLLYSILQKQHPVYLKQIISCAPDKVKDRLIFLATMGLADLKKNKVLDPIALGFADFEELQFAMQESIQEEAIGDITDCIKNIMLLQESEEVVVVMKETLKPKICARDVIGKN